MAIEFVRRTVYLKTSGLNAAGGEYKKQVLHSCSTKGCTAIAHGYDSPALAVQALNTFRYALHQG